MRVTISLIPSWLTGPVLSGEVAPSVFDVALHEARSVNANTLEMLKLEYDIGEMSIATFVKAREQGLPLLGLPIFTGRRFLQRGVGVRGAAAIEGPSDLRGKKVVLPQFWQSSSVWHRIVLRQMHNIRQEEVTWVTMAKERLETLAFPPGVQICRDVSGRTLMEMMEAGEVDGVMGSPRLLAKLGEISAVHHWKPAYADGAAAEQEYYQKTGIFPIMHMLVIRESLGDAPELLAAICELFAKAKERAMRRLAENSSAIRSDPDLWAYGLSASRNTLESFLSHAFDQGLIGRELSVSDLFAQDIPAAYK